MRGPQLGVQVDDLDFGRLDSLGLPYGIEVTHVTVGSPAEADGLRAGDVIVKMDRRTIRNIDDVQRVLDYFEPSERLKLEIIRDKNRKQLEIGRDPIFRAKLPKISVLI